MRPRTEGGYRFMGGPLDGGWTGELASRDGVPPKELYTPYLEPPQPRVAYEIAECRVIVHVYRWGSGSYWYEGEKR